MSGINAVSVAAVEEGRAGEYEMVAKKEESVRLSPDIEWVNLNMTVQKHNKKILNDCWGSVSFSLMWLPGALLSIIR